MCTYISYRKIKCKPIFHYRHIVHTGKSGSAQDLPVQIRRHQRGGHQRMGNPGTADHAQEERARGTENTRQQGSVHRRLHQLAVRK